MRVSLIGMGCGGAAHLLPAAAEHVYFSSTMAREMIKYEQDLTAYLPEKVAERLMKGRAHHG